MRSDVMRELEQYLALPYTIVLRRDEDGDFLTRVEELPGCVSHGATPEEALKNIEEAKEAWIAERIESGQPVPEPPVEDLLPSGKWVQRVPRTLHKRLSELAKRENVSLNQLVTSLLSQAVGGQAIVMQSKAALQEQEPESSIDTWRTCRWGSVETEDPWEKHYAIQFVVPKSVARIPRLPLLDAFEFLRDVMPSSPGQFLEVERHVSKREKEKTRSRAR
jgi:antitoxin HicB